MFFEENYSAFKSRTILKSLLEETGVFSVFDKISSFDRLFPNQDYLSGKGFGNLIALPLNKISWDNGNSCFINPETLLPFEHHGSFLKQKQRLKNAKDLMLDGEISASEYKEMKVEIEEKINLLSIEELKMKEGHEN